jgi:hypothetical protein
MALIGFRCMVYICVYKLSQVILIIFNYLVLNMYTIEQVKKLRVKRLLEQGVIRSGAELSGKYIWPDGFGFTYKSVMLDDVGTLRLLTGSENTNGTNYICIQMTAKRCHFGGFRWYFKCNECSRLCCVLYKWGRKFVCRKCTPLVYYSQLTSSKWKRSPFREVEIDKYLDEKVKQLYYKGKPTRMYRTYLNKMERFYGGKNYCEETSN